LIKSATVTVMVGNMENAVEFYTRTLGLELRARYGNEFAQVEAPGAVISLHPSIEGGSKPSNSQSLSIGFAVDDLDKTITELKSKGVQFSKISDDVQVRLAFFTDLDGNPLYLSESKWQ
jgi:catechol 2,3-dioxygenase-like lactoylglutathione lyase family enzyme